MSLSTDSTHFAWDPPPELQTCTTQVLTWSYHGLTIGMLNITITDIGVNQNAPIMSSTPSPKLATSRTPITSRFSTPTTSTASVLVGTSAPRTDYCPTLLGVARRLGPGPRCAYRGVDDGYDGYNGSWLPSINQTLAMNISAEDSTWTWPSVNVTEGWYVLVANVVDGDAMTNTSSPFFVRNVTTSCLVAAPPFPMFPNTTSATTGGTSATNVSSRGPRTQPFPTAAVAGGAGGGTILLLGVLVTVAIVQYRRRRSSQFVRVDSAPSESMNRLEPYDATNEQFPTQRRTTFLPLAGRSSHYVTKELRQPLRHGPRIAEVNHQLSERAVPLEGAEEPQVQHESQLLQEPTEMVSVSVGALQRLLRRVEGVWTDLQRPEGSDDALSGTAPPGYEEAVRS